MTRFPAYAAPALMLAYGVLRWIDGLDGTRHNSWAWDAGHVAFFIAIVLFAILAEGLRRNRPGALATVATIATAAGAFSFLWVITGDLYEPFPQLPSMLQMAGPAVFELGLLTLLIQQVVARRLPIWTPILVLLGFVAIPINLDLLPLASLLVGVGLVPLWVSRAGWSSLRSSGHFAPRS